MVLSNKYQPIGLPAIDDEHKEIIQLMNDIAFAFDSGAERSALNRLPSVLTALSNHFNREEELLDKIGFPNSDQHIEEHRQILASVEASLTEVAAIKDFEARRARFGEFVKSVIRDIEIADDEIRTFVSNMG